MRNRQERMDLLKSLCLAFGPTGCEEEVAELILKEIYPTAHRITKDRLGNLIAEMHFGDATEGRTRMMISAHMDEVGMMVRSVRDDGTLLFGTVGGIDPSVLPGRFVTVKGKDGMHNAVIASKAIHHKEKRKEKRRLPSKRCALTREREARRLRRSFLPSVILPPLIRSFSSSERTIPP